MDKVKLGLANSIGLMVAVGVVTVLGSLVPSLDKHSVLLGVLAGRLLLTPVAKKVLQKLK